MRILKEDRRIAKDRTLCKTKPQRVRHPVQEPVPPAQLCKTKIANIGAKKDADIDLTDMPEVLDWCKAESGKLYQPAKKPVTIRLDTDIRGVPKLCE